MTPCEILLRRLRNQHIRGNPFPTPAETVRHFGAVQAQDYRGGLWAVGLRTAGTDETAIESSIEDRSVVRTWPMRGTLHFVAACDVRWMLALLTPRVIARSAGRHRQLGLEPPLFPRCRRLFEKALRNGGRKTRDEMHALLRAAGISPDGQRGIHILQQLAQDGILCFGPRQGRQQTCVLLDEWVPGARPRPRDEALAELALRYFTSHGPATVQDYAWWSSLSSADARRGLESSAALLERDSDDGKDYWGPRDGPPRAQERNAALLLPPFDEFLVAYKDRSAALDPSHARHIPSLLSPTIVVKGRIVGTWTRTLGRNGVVVVPRFFGRPGPAELRSVAAAAVRYGRFLGLDAELSEGQSLG
jgi:hypothetical protein